MHFSLIFCCFTALSLSIELKLLSYIKSRRADRCAEYIKTPEYCNIFSSFLNGQVTIKGIDFLTDKSEIKKKDVEDMDLKWLDSLEFEAIPVPVCYYDVPKLVVNEKGQMSMNLAFQRVAGQTRCFYGEVGKDGRCLLLRPDEGGQLRFSPKGVRKNQAFSDRLKERGIQLPAVYSLEWLNEREMWAGCSNDLPKPPQVKVRSSKRSRI